MKRIKMLSLIMSLTMLSFCVMPVAIAMKPENVAKIGEIEYVSLEDAVSHAQSGDTITILKDVTNIGATVFQGDKNLTVDFNGNTVMIGGSVGSQGTETNGFQLLKGSSITFKNGVIKPLPTSNIKLLIQNYCNLTLQDITLDAREDSKITYVLSNNCGNVIIKGNSNIYASANKQAFDLWYGMHESYDSGITVTFDKTFTGTVQGKIEYGAASRAASQNWTSLCNLTIKGGTFDTTFVDGSASDGATLANSNIKIYGGTFSEDISMFVVGENNTTRVGSVYKVAPKATDIKMDDSTLVLGIGKTLNLKVNLVPSTTLDLITYTSSNEKVATVDSTGKVTAIASGISTITATVGTLTTTSILTVFNSVKTVASPVDPEKSTNQTVIGIGSDSTAKIDKHIDDVISSLVNSDDVSTDIISLQTQEALKDAIDAGKTITTKVSADFLDIAAISQTDKDKISDLIKKIVDEDSTAVIAHYVDLGVELLANDNILGQVNKFDNPLTFTVDVPESLIKDGRIYYVIRLHNGVPEKIKAVLNPDKTISFETDRFSTFALVYEDQTPMASKDETIIANTGDSNTGLSYLVLISASFLEIVCFLIYEKKTGNKIEDNKMETHNN